MTFLDLMELQPGVSPALISKTVTNVLRLEMANEEMLPLLHSLIDGLTDEIVQSGKGSSLILCSLLETRAGEGNILLNSSFFLKLVQCQSRLNPEIQPFVVEGIGFTHN